MDKEMTVAEQRDFKIQRRIHRGKILLKIASILLIVSAVAMLLAFVYMMCGNDGSPVVNFEDVIDVVQTFALPLEAVFFLLAAIGGFSFIKEKGPLERIVSFASIVFLLLLFANFAGSLHELIRHGKWLDFIQNVVFVNFSGLVYAIGWFLCKDEF